jgi:hypothetical protein
MSMQYIRQCYGVPARRGARVRFSGGNLPAVGVIVGSRQQYLRVKFDGMSRPMTLHPAWKVEYLP